MLSAERRDPDGTIRPRLDAAGADVHRIDLIQAVTAIDRDTKEPTSRMVSLKRDLDAVVEQVRTVTRKDHKPAF